MKIYGIKTCDSVKKALKFMKDNHLEYEFIDLKKTPVDEHIITSWLHHITIDTLFNKRGTTYRTLKLKELSLNVEEQKNWLIKENLLIKRPVIEYQHQVIVGYDEEQYKTLFLV